MSALLWISALTPALGHEVRPALLLVTERPEHHYDFMWKRPAQGGTAVHLRPRISGGLLDGPPDAVVSLPDFEISYWRDVPSALDGRTLQVEGLDQTITDALVSITLANGRSIQAILSPQKPHLILNLHEMGAAVHAYVVLGIQHILTGTDHLAFVFGLMMLVRRMTPLIKTITAFSIAHSITLAATALHVISVYPAVIESLVALSIVFVAVELVHCDRGEESITARYPWMVAFTFGLLHGAAFAGALAEVGLPSNDIPLSLLLFNVGVELGQLLFIATVFTIGWMLSRLLTRIPEWTQRFSPYAIGPLAAFWFIERLCAALR
jgi:hydrogenase/urease accessory protein HupE